MTASNRTVDVVIIGGGPAGCATGLFTARSDLETLIFDRGKSSIDHCAYLENYLGFPAGIDIETFCGLAHDHAEAAGCEILEEMVVSVGQTATGFEVETQDGRTVETDRVVAAAKYDAEYLRPLGEEMFKTVERDGESRERFDREYPAEDGTTPIDGLYVVGPLAGVPDQVLISAGHGGIVGRQIRADARRDQRYWEHVADRVDWVRKHQPNNEWTKPERWRQWVHERRPPREELDLSDAKIELITEDIVEESLETYLTPEEVDERQRAGHRAIAQALDEDVLLEVLEEQTVREFFAASLEARR